MGKWLPTTTTTPTAHNSNNTQNNCNVLLFTYNTKVSISSLQSVECTHDAFVTTCDNTPQAHCGLSVRYTY